MKKEIIISLLIIIGIIISDVILQKYTNSTMDSLNNELIELKNEVKEKNIYSKGKVNKINKIWDKNFKKYTCYLEHDELEKINTQLVIISSGIDLKDRDYVCEEIDKAVYIINHIKSKQMLKLDNLL